MEDVATDKVETEPVAELETPEVVVEEPLLEPKADNTPAPHPLQPGGRRFEQIYAKGKQAERDALDLRERLIAAEAKIDLLTKLPSQTQAQPATGKEEYTWSELETFIQQGRITRAEAEQHREEVIARRIEKNFEARQEKRTVETTREQQLDATIQGYISAAPSILKADSAERVRLDEEFDAVALIHGIDPEKASNAQRKALQVAALRNVYGPVDSLTRRTTSVKRETLQEVGGMDKPRLKPNPDQEFLNKLTKTEVEHYNKMFKAGRYPNRWKDVVEELKFVKPARSHQ